MTVLEETTPFFVDNEAITLTRNGLWIADVSKVRGTFWLEIAGKKIRLA